MRRAIGFLAFISILGLIPGIAPASEADGALASIRLAEYAFSTHAGSVQAPNRAHGFRTRVQPDGVVIVPREQPNASVGAVLHLTLTHVLRGDLEVEVAPGLVDFDGHRAEIRRRSLTEWFVNGVDGLEHGVDLPAPPVDGPGRVVLRYRLGEGVLATSVGPDGVRFDDPGGRPWLRYDGLVVTDALGVRLDAELRLGTGAVDLVFDDRDAVYPVTVDPLLSSAVWSFEPNQTSAFVGAVSSTAGDVNGDGYSDILVSAYGYDAGQTNEGRVWLYYGSPSGPAGTPEVLESNQAGAQFGYSVGAAGDLNGDGYDDFVIGANLYDTTLVNVGAVYLYLGSSSGPNLKRIIEGVQSGAELGRAVATAGDVNNDGLADVVVTAFNYDAGQTDEGRAYVYHGNGNGLSDDPDWIVDGNQASARFGTSACTAGDTNGDGYDDVIVGAYLWDEGQTDEGAAFVYLGSASGLSTTAAWMQDGDWPGGRFGFSVAPADDVDCDGYADIVVGAYLTDFSLDNEGAAFVYLGGPGGPSLSRHVSWYGGQAGANLGRSVFTAGDVNGDGFADVAVGAPLYDAASGGSGRVLVFHGSAAGLSTTPDWIEDGNKEADEFGKSVATAGDVDGDGFSDLLVGDPTYDGGHTNEGILRVYLGSGDGLDDARTTRQGVAALDYFGFVVDSAGDVNGDGFSDLLASRRGAELRAYYGGPNGTASSPSWVATNPPNSTTTFGNALSSAGDVNGDGFDDVLVGDPEYSGDVIDEGRVALYLGSASGLQSSAHRLFAGNFFQSEFGAAVASAGDVNGDGYADIVIGAPNWDTGRGAVFVYHGGPSGPDSTSPTDSVEGGVGDRWGEAVASAGDVDGDGYSDLIACGGSHFEIYVYPGSAAGVRLDAPWVLTPGGGNCASVASAGDVNGDGYADVAIGNDVLNRVSVYHGSPTGPSEPAETVLEIFQSGGSGFGRVDSAGDVDNDGYSDLVVGAPAHDAAGGSASGRAYVFLGSASGLATSPAWTADGDQANASFGRWAASAGDVNGDGFGDVVLGEPDWDQGGSANVGRMHVYLGGGGDGLDRIPRQQQPAGVSQPPIAMLGRSPDDDRIRLRTRARSAAGRIRVRAEYDVRPWDTPYPGEGNYFSSVLKSSAPGSDGTRTNYSSPISGLSPGTRYKWRLRARSVSPYFPWTPWVSLPGNGVQEWAVRTDCTEATWFRDADGDTFGDADVSVSTCEPQPSGYVADASDCDDGNGDVWAIPSATGGLALSDDGATTTLTWSPPGDPGANPGAWAYDVLRADAPDGFAGPGTCLATDVAAETASDPDLPVTGAAFHYLVRAGHACGDGTLGFDSGGAERVGSACP